MSDEPRALLAFLKFHGDNSDVTLDDVVAIFTGSDAGERYAIYQSLTDRHLPELSGVAQWSALSFPTNPTEMSSCMFEDRFERAKKETAKTNKK